MPFYEMTQEKMDFPNSKVKSNIPQQKSDGEYFSIILHRWIIMRKKLNLTVRNISPNLFFKVKPWLCLATVPSSCVWPLGNFKRNGIAMSETNSKIDTLDGMEGTYVIRRRMLQK